MEELFKSFEKMEKASELMYVILEDLDFMQKISVLASTMHEIIEAEGLEVTTTMHKIADMSKEITEALK